MTSKKLYWNIKYGITKEAFEDYNDITNIKPGDKVIIPKTSE